ncbi:NUDIX hydrolase [Nocardioides sp.]|uniref:NUDIX hydrolase n=1 Tax=Nocardioides sp. TaxID=35761 RepID=UPI002B2696DB|nr:NUDIX hydrolase [Nocardioides sp.]
MTASTATDAPGSPAADVLAAGVVVSRPGRQVLLVHRPKYDDWSFPKGKLDPGEHRTVAAVREVAEETGLHVRLASPLASQRYPLSSAGKGRCKTVFYWTGRVVGDDDVSCYRPNDEIDAVEWVPADEAVERLTYPHDRETLVEALGCRKKSQAVVVLRHAKSRSRKAWRRDDRERPLLDLGRAQAERLVPVLAAYGVTRVLSSTSTRCLQTVEPFADTTGWELESTASLSEEGADAALLDQIAEGVRADGRPTVLCTHRPVLPLLCDALDVDDPGLEVSDLLVLQVRRGRVVSHEHLSV